MCCHGDHWCSPHTMSPPVWGWSRLVADDAGRLQTSSLPLGRRPIFTTGHNVYQAARHIYGTASNPSLPGEHLPPHSASFSPFSSQKHCCFRWIFSVPWIVMIALLKVFFLSYQRENSHRPSPSRTGLSQEGLPQSAIREISLYVVDAGCVILCGHYMRYEILKMHKMTNEAASIGMFIYPFRSPFAFEQCNAKWICFWPRAHH